MSVSPLNQPLRRVIAGGARSIRACGVVRPLSTSLPVRAAVPPEDDPKKGGHTFWSVSCSTSIILLLY